MSEVLVSSYQDRACAFVDILGFSSAVRRMSDDQAIFTQVMDALTGVRENRELNKFLDGELKTNIFSDSVIFSAPVTDSGLSSIVDAITFLTLDLLEVGYFLRGGITIGKLYHDDEIIVGPALLDAYFLEDEIAKFPRVVVSKAFEKLYRKYNDEIEFMYPVGQRLKRADDGPIFINSARFLAHLANEGDEAEGRSASMIKRAIAIENQLRIRLDEATENPAHYEKVWWFCVYWNQYALSLEKIGLRGVIPPAY